MAETLTPHDLDAEKAVLGAILVDGERFHDARATGLTPSDFFRRPHGVLFGVMTRMIDRREPVDFVTLKTALGADALNDVGGPAYIAALADGVPRSINAEYYAGIIRDKAIRRRLQAAAIEIGRSAADPQTDTKTVLDRAERAIHEIADNDQRGELVSAESVVQETWPILERIMESHKTVSGVPSGFADLDRLTRGFQPGNLILLAARPAIGKTSLGLNVAHHAATIGGATVGMFSLEMSRSELMIRLLTATGRLDSHRLMSGYLPQTQYENLTNAMGRVSGSDLWIDDSSSLSVIDIRRKARRLKGRKGLGLVVIDYLQLLSSEKRFDNRVVEVGAMSRALKQLAKELEVPVLALAQLSRAAEAREGGRPKLSDLRESGSLEQDADMVLMLHRAEEYQSTPENAGLAEIIIAKHRNGPTGAVKLRWCRESTRFDNWTTADAGARGAQ